MLNAPSAHARRMPLLPRRGEGARALDGQITTAGDGKAEVLEAVVDVEGPFGFVGVGGLGGLYGLPVLVAEDVLDSGLGS